MPVLDFNSPGQEQALRTSSDYLDATTGNPMPTKRFCNRCTIQLLNLAATVYIGLQAPAGVGANVSSTNFDIRLDASSPSFTIGPLDRGNGVDLGATYWDANSADAQISIAPVLV